jgi:REase_MTES_1575
MSEDSDLLASLHTPFSIQLLEEDVPQLTARRVGHWLGIDWLKMSSFSDMFRMQRERFLGNCTQDFIRRYHEVAEHGDRVIAPCESPIEELFLSYFHVAAGSEGYRSGLPSEDAHECAIFEYGPFAFDVPDWRAHTYLLQQLPVAGYRLDFALQRGDTNIAIELDGHDFHERTKQQAMRDKSRDRKLTELGWRVLRFTGSEVWKSPVDVAQETWRILRTTVGKDP